MFRYDSHGLRRYVDAGMVTTERISENSIFLYHGKKGYDDWVANPKIWDNISGLPNDCYEIFGWIDLDAFKPVPCKAHEVIKGLQNWDYITFFGEPELAKIMNKDFGKYVGLRSPGWNSEQFCDDKITAYLPPFGYEGK